MSRLVLFLISRSTSILSLGFIVNIFIFRALKSGAVPYDMGKIALATTLVTIIGIYPLSYLLKKLGPVKSIFTSYVGLIAVTTGIVIVDPYNLNSIILFSAAVAFFKCFRSFSQFNVFGKILVHSTNKEKWVHLSTLSWQVSAFVAPLVAGLLGDQKLTIYLAIFLMVVSMVSQYVLIYFCSLEFEKTNTDVEKVFNINRVKEFLDYLSKNNKITSALMLDFFIVLFASAQSLVPFLHENSKSPLFVGLIRSAVPAGVIIGTYFIINKKLVLNWSSYLLKTTIAFSICNLLLAFSVNIYFSLFLLLLTGIFDAVSLGVREALLNTETDLSYRNSVYALNTILVTSSDELSEWQSGVFTNFFGIRSTIFLSGLLAMTGSVYFKYKIDCKVRKQVVN